MRLENGWIRNFERLRRNEFDFTWMNELSGFDHWNLESQGPLSELVTSQKFVPPSAWPIPDVVDITTFAKVRMMKGVAKRESVAAFKHVRKLAQLLLTTENLSLMTAGLAILDLERQAYRFATEEQMIAPEEWTPVDRNLTRRASRAIWALRGYLFAWTPPEHLQKIFLDRELNFGFCGAINEGLPSELTLRPMLDTQLPLAHGASAGYQKLDTIWARAAQSCRLKYLKALMTSSNFAAELPIPRLLTWLPYSRQLYAMKLSSMGFTGFQAYQAVSGPKN